MISGVYALDNDAYSQFLQGHERITSRILSVPRDAIRLPAIVVEEQVRGRLAVLAGLNSSRAADRNRIPQAYELLLKTILTCNLFPLLSYTPEAETLWQSWPSAIKRLGTRDCRIAASAITKGLTVVTCNLRHFTPIPNIKVEDWSV